MEENSLYRYHVIPEEYYHPDIGNYLTYGIQVENLEYVHDVSTYKAIVASLAAMFTEYQLSPIHLLYAVMDMIP